MTDQPTDELEQFAQAWERSHGLPPGGRDPAEVRHELTCRRAAALLLHGRLTGRRDDELAAMTIALQLCFDRPGLTPCAVFVGPTLTLVTCLPDPWRAQFAERLREAGMIAAAEAEVTEDPELARDCHATEAAAVIMCGRLDGNQELAEHGWALAEAAAARYPITATAAGVLHGPVLGLTRDHLHGEGRQRLVDALREVLMEWAPIPDTPEGLT